MGYVRSKRLVKDDFEVFNRRYDATGNMSWNLYNATLLSEVTGLTIRIDIPQFISKFIQPKCGILYLEITTYDGKTGENKKVASEMQIRRETKTATGTSSTTSTLTPTKGVARYEFHEWNKEFDRMYLVLSSTTIKCPGVAIKMIKG